MPSTAKIEGGSHPPSKVKSDDDGETDAETAASTPARSSASSSNSAHKDVIPAKTDSSLPSEIDTSNTEAAVNEEQYKDWPLVDIKDPHSNDVLYGRGGGTNHHPGNKRYRKLVEARKVDYVNSKRLDKPLVALDIIKMWRSQKPPGRFLKIDEDSGLWHDVGDKKAREKTSQALREKAPLLRKQQEEQRKEREVSVKVTTTTKEKLKTTRFDVPVKDTPKTNKNLKRVLLARDHSLGRDYISPDEPVSVKGFSWNSPIVEAKSEDANSNHASWDGSSTGPKEKAPSIGSGSASRGLPNPYVERDRFGVSPYSSGSPTRYSGNWASSHGAHNAHTPNDKVINDWKAGGYRTDEGPRNDYSASHYDYRRTRSLDDRYYKNNHPYYPQNPQPTPSSHDSNLKSDDYKRFANIVGTGSESNNNNYMQNWKSMNSPRHHSEPMYDTSPYHSPDRLNPMTPSSYGHHWNSPNASSFTSPPHGMGYYNNSPYHSQGQSFNPQPVAEYSNGNDISGCSTTNEGIPRPPTVKRDTSHKLQTGDVEPTTKRLNRQISAGRRNTSISSIEEITEKHMDHLNVSMKRSSLEKEDTPERPQSLKDSDRLSTMDFLEMDVQVPVAPVAAVAAVSTSIPDSSSQKSEKPQTLGQGDRMTTMDQINILVKDIDASSPYPLEFAPPRQESEESGNSGLDISKPSALGESDRINTLGTIDSDFFAGISHTSV